ncbi:MAG: helix-turn-helix domain-containing protein [Ferrovibrionaceae bacterium]
MTATATGPVHEHDEDDDVKRRAPRGIDRFVGRRIAEFRVARGLTQEQLAQLLDRSMNDIQRLEHGSRANATVLWRVAQTLGCEVSDLFQGARPDDDRPADEPPTRGERITLEISRAVGRIASADAKYALLELARAIADGEQRGTLNLAELTDQLAGSALSAPARRRQAGGR